MRVGPSMGVHHSALGVLGVGLYLKYKLSKQMNSQNTYLVHILNDKNWLFIKVFFGS
jgi:hypothetical protein